MTMTATAAYAPNLTVHMPPQPHLNRGCTTANTTRKPRRWLEPPNETKVHWVQEHKDCQRRFPVIAAAALADVHQSHAVGTRQQGKERHKHIGLERTYSW